MVTRRRNYQTKTLKALFALSGNQCANPKCTIPIIERDTKNSNAAIIAHICHIYAHSPDGPRGNNGLSEKEIKSYDNLILLCPYHHQVVDKQPETYTAELLKKWKTEHESTAWGNIRADTSSNVHFPTELVNQRISKEIDMIRKSRFFEEFDKSYSSLKLARKIITGELSGGSDELKGKALAWCVRLLSRAGELNEAEKYLRIAKKIGAYPEIAIADAYISSQKGDKNTALSTLAGIDSPISRSAALMFIKYHDGPQDAINWMATSGTDAISLDSDGKYAFLTCQLNVADWEGAQESLDMITKDDLNNTPALYQMVAITYLLKAIPDESRSTIISQLPFNLKEFPLASTPDAIRARQSAHAHFINAVNILHELNCPLAAAICDEYALWLELRDPYEPDQGEKRLKEQLRDHESVLRLVCFGIQFGIQLDLEAIEREIERQTALNGKITRDAAIARFSLAYTPQKTPKDSADYIARYFDDLSPYINRKMMNISRILMLLHAKLPEKANEILEHMLMEKELSNTEERRLRSMISTARGANSIDYQREQFENTDSLSDLMILINKLEIKDDWDDVCKYSQLLFERTHTLDHAEQLATALYHTQKKEELIEFLASNRTLVAQSRDLKMLLCWSLYDEGRLLEARSELTQLSHDCSDSEYQNLQINIAIYSGDWHSLSPFIDNEFKEKEKRSAQELLRVAQLALYLDLPRAKELIFAAASKGNDDANVLANAYWLATSAGWDSEDDNERTFQWINRAVMLSGESGPIQKMTLKDLLSQKQDWDRRESDIWKMLSLGDIPMFSAARYLNKSLIDLMLASALVNLSKTDPRRRSAIPAYSGARHQVPFNLRGKIGIDASALLTLSFLNLLDEVLDLFDTVYIPHSTLSWLFLEKQKAAFHQPSQIKGAHKVRNLLAANVLEKFSASAVPDNDLSTQIGENLALLIAEAKEAINKNDVQHIVVVPFPIYQVSSLMEEEADLTKYETMLSSCQAIVGKLRQKGQITSREEEKAYAYLKLQEKPWPNQPRIADGAILYLDELTITYFLHLGILEKLKAAGFRLILSPETESETNELITYENISDKLKNTIESIRAAVSTRINSGKIKIGKRTYTNKPDEQSIYEHSTIGIFSLAKHCDAIIVDDRFINQHANILDNNTQDRSVPIFSTLDLIDALVSTGSKTVEEQMEYRTLLRRTGYFFMPISVSELTNHLKTSNVENGRVVETAELKAIRENISRVRMSDFLQLPKEEHWLDTLLMVFVQALKDLWQADADSSSTWARSDWLIAQTDTRGWSHCLNQENENDIIKTKYGKYILMMLMPPINAKQNIIYKYWDWLENRILAPIKEQHPSLYSWIVKQKRENIAIISDMNLPKEKQNDE